MRPVNTPPQLLHAGRLAPSFDTVPDNGISLEYRPPGRPQFGAHIERYLGTLMRRIHGLPGTTYSNPIERGKYRSEARATMIMAELERWMALAHRAGYGVEPLCAELHPGE